MKNYMKKFIYIFWGIISSVVVPVTVYLNAELLRKGLGYLGLSLVGLGLVLWMTTYLFCIQRYLLTKNSSAEYEVIFGLLISIITVLPPTLKFLSFWLYVAVFHNPYLTVFLIANYVLVGVMGLIIRFKSVYESRNLGKDNLP